MHALSEDLSSFACAIAQGHGLPQNVQATGLNYPVDTAIEIYRNNYRGNLHDALAGVYPVIEQLVGKDFFRLLSRRYIEQHPSRSGNLHHYGAEMAVFVAGFVPAQGLVYLHDVAALEWACHQAYYAPDTAALDIITQSQKISASLSSAQYFDLQLHLHPACHVICSRYPIATIWRCHQPGASSDFQIDLNSGSCFVLVSRRNNVVCIDDLSVADASWLLDIQQGNTLGVATAAALERDPGFDLQAGLLNLVTRGVVSNFSLGETS